MESDDGGPDSSGDFLSRLPAGAIVHTDPVNDQDPALQELFRDPSKLVFDIREGNIPPSIEDPEFNGFWRQIDKSEPHFHVIDPVFGIHEVHAFRCGDEEFYRVAPDVWYSCLSQGVYVRLARDEAAPLPLNDDMKRWFQEVVALELGTKTGPFQFLVLTREEEAATQRVFEVVKLRGKYPKLTRLD